MIRAEPRPLEQLPKPLASTVADTMAWRKLLTSLGRSTLARVDQHCLQIHRLTGAILRDWFTPERSVAARALAGIILVANDPGDSADPACWPGWAQILPHILAIEPSAGDNPSLRRLTSDATWYVLRRGDIRGGYDPAKDLYDQWMRQLAMMNSHFGLQTTLLGHCGGWPSTLRDEIWTRTPGPQPPRAGRGPP